MEISLSVPYYIKSPVQRY